MRHGWTAGFILFAVIAALTAWRIAAANAGGDARPTGTLQVRVMDGRTLEPIPNALVVIPEADRREKTGRDGSTDRMEAAVIPDAQLNGILEVPWGEVTVLVYCDGYYPFALFHCQVLSGLDRDGPTVYLFPDDGSLSEPFSLIESPNPGWVLSLLEKYDPYAE